MIYGIGTDLVQLSRIARTWNRFGDRFVRRILSPREIVEFERYTQPKAQFLASRYFLYRTSFPNRWAIKEATYKALRHPGIPFNAIQVLPDHHNIRSPLHLEFDGKAKEVATESHITASHLSVSHENDMCVAFVILESNFPLLSNKEPNLLQNDTFLFLLRMERILRRSLHRLRIPLQCILAMRAANLLHLRHGTRLPRFLPLISTPFSTSPFLRKQQRLLINHLPNLLLLRGLRALRQLLEREIHRFRRLDLALSIPNLIEIRRLQRLPYRNPLLRVFLSLPSFSLTELQHSFQQRNRFRRRRRQQFLEVLALHGLQIQQKRLHHAVVHRLDVLATRRPNNLEDLLQLVRLRVKLLRHFLLAVLLLPRGAQREARGAREQRADSHRVRLQRLQQFLLDESRGEDTP